MEIYINISCMLKFFWIKGYLYVRLLGVFYIEGDVIYLLFYKEIEKLSKEMYVKVFYKL